MSVKKRKDDDEIVFGKKSSRFEIWLSVFFSSIIFYFHFIYPDSSGEEIIIALVIWGGIIIISTFYGAHHLVISNDEISIVGSINNKKRVRVLFEDIQRVYFYLPNSGDGFSTVFNIKIKLKDQKKQIIKPIGLSRTEIRKVAVILEEQGVDVDYDLEVN